MLKCHNIVKWFINEKHTIYLFFCKHGIILGKFDVFMAELPEAKHAVYNRRHHVHLTV